MSQRESLPSELSGSRRWKLCGDWYEDADGNTSYAVGVDGVWVMPVSEHEEHVAELAAKLSRVREEREEVAGEVEYVERERDRAEAELLGLREAAQTAVGGARERYEFTTVRTDDIAALRAALGEKP